MTSAKNNRQMLAASSGRRNWGNSLRVSAWCPKARPVFVPGFTVTGIGEGEQGLQFAAAARNSFGVPHAAITPVVDAPKGGSNG
ncbi:MAG: hypothetical protein SOW59_08430 [Corynebacterium sp.]|nr:hypothetical protein [Corynebacterium sp.]